MPPSINKHQLALDIGDPLSHHERLHQAPHGVVLVWERLKSEKRWTKIAPSDPAAAIVASFAGGQDTYITVNQFVHWRLISQLRSLRACYVDIDGCTDLERALDTLTQMRMPPPSFVVFSGRGMHLYWTLQPIQSKALPVWQAIQDALIKSLTLIGSDKKARDCTRVLRLVGTTNSKNNEEARGLVLTGAMWTLHELADEVLGERPAKSIRTAQLHDLSAAGARQGKKVRPHTGSIYDWWYLVYKDLCAVIDHHWFGGVPAGHRDNILFLMSCALSWYAPIDILEDEICRTAQTFMPTFGEQEIKTQMQSIIARAQIAASGKKLVWQGKEIDARYRFKAETMREWLGDLLHPDLHDQLRALAPPDVIKRRKQERDGQRDRVAEGRYKQTRDEYTSAINQRTAEIHNLHAKGLSNVEIARQLGITAKTVYRSLKEDPKWTSAPSLYGPPPRREGSQLQPNGLSASGPVFKSVVLHG